MTPTAALLLALTVSAAPPAVELVGGTGAEAFALAVHVETDGRPSGERWATAVAAVFDHADADKDGLLNAVEAKRVLSALRVRQLGWGYLWAVPQAADWNDLDPNADGRATRDEVAAYYRRHGAAGPQVGVGTAASASALNAALLKHLDADHDGRVTETEWKAAAEALKPLDRDEDELIRPAELVARTLYPGSAGGLLFTPKAADLPLRLTPADAAAGHKTSCSLTVRLGTSKPKDAPVAWSQPPPGLRVIAFPAGSSVGGDFAAARTTAGERFAAADANGDGVLDAAEAKAAAYAPLTDHFAFADRDNDGRLAKAEWEAYLGVRAKLVAAAVTVTLLSHGRGLFEALDADGDGALSVRELRGAWPRLTALKCVTAGRLDLATVPPAVRLVVSRSRPLTLLPSPPRAGPDWFLAMDRNRDGDVSRTEFVGTADAFRNLDADGDGLISAAEAGGPAGR